MAKKISKMRQMQNLREFFENKKLVSNAAEMSNSVRNGKKMAKDKPRQQCIRKCVISAPLPI